MARWREMELACWGKTPVEPCAVARPEKQGELTQAMADKEVSSVLARGLGRSYGDAALNGHSKASDSQEKTQRGVLLTERLNRFISFDPQTGELHAEAGLSIGRIIECFLTGSASDSSATKWFPWVTPGTRHVTLGGAIAADVHGKNHHSEGSFGKFVDGFSLLLPTGERVWCSRDENAPLFTATLGGLGLTGVIESVLMQLRPVRGGQLSVNRVRTSSLQETMNTLEQMGTGGSNAKTYSVAWLDCLKGGSKMGRGVVFGGEHAETTSGTHPEKSGIKQVPFDMPGFTLNRLSVAAFNAAYWTKNRSRTINEGWSEFFYPLDGVENWNRIYGKRGFQQWQVVVPFETGTEGVQELLERIVQSKRASFLAVLKSMGERSEGTLGFGRPGWTLALDFAQTAGLNELLGELDDAAIRMGGVRYLVKDACLTQERFEAMYPEAEDFRKLRREIDPKGRISSSLGRRLGL